MFLDKYWPSKTEVSSCIRRDAETVSEALLLAVHRKMSFDVQKANKIQLKDEQELLRAFLDVADGGTLVLPIMGASGVGKSHVIRWLHANLKQSETNKNLHIIRIPKTASLKQVVDYILEPLSDDKNYASIRSDLDMAVDVGNQQASIIRFMAELENVLDEHAVKLNTDRQKTTDRDELKILRTLIGFTKQIPFLMGDPAVKKHFVETVLSRITKRAHSGSKDEDDLDQYENQQQFRVDDFRLPRSVSITQASASVQTFYNIIDGSGNDSVRQKIVDFLNADQLIDKAIRNTYNLNRTLGGKSIPDLILQIREKLFGDGKELVLLIEDMAAIAGFQETLFNIAIQQDTDQNGKSVRCIMRTAIAVTDGYQMADTIATRARQKWIIKAKEVTDDAALLADITDMVGAYLNAARWGENELKNRYSRSDKLTDWLPVFEDGGITDDERQCLTNFGHSRSGFALFPFNKVAINRLVKNNMVDASGKITFRPRELIENVLKNVLDRRGDFENNEFPRDLGLAESGFIARYVNRLSYNDIEKEKARSLLSVWGNNLQTDDDIKKFPKAVFEAFGLQPPKEIEGTGGVSEPEVVIIDPHTPIKDPIRPQPNITNKFTELEAELNDWVGGKMLLSPTTANTLRKAIAKTVDNFIPWWNLDVPKPDNTLTHLAYKIHRSHGDDGFATRKLEVCTSNKDPNGTLRGTFLAIYRHHANSYTWDYPEGENDYIASIELIERLSKERLDFQSKINLNEIKILSEALTLQSRVLGFDPPLKTKPFGSYLTSLFETVDPKPFNDEISPEWSELRLNILSKDQTGSSWRKKLQEELKRKSACFRGEEGDAIAIDIIRIKQAGNSSSDKKPSQILPNFSDYFQLAPERAFKTNANKLANILREQSNKINELIGDLDHFSKEKFLSDFDAFLEKLRDTGQYPKDERLPSWDIIRDLVSNMQKTALKETLNKISIILNIDFGEDQDGLSKGLNALGSLHFDQVAVINKFFEVADVLVMLSSEKITGWLANADLVDAEKSKNDLLQKLKYIGELS